MGMRSLILLSILILMFCFSIDAQWWKFGKRAEGPRITSLYLGKINAEEVEEELIINPEDLEGGALKIWGKAEVSRGEIGKVKISFDGGENWVEAKVKEGSFYYEFKPEENREYHFLIYAVDTAGRKSDPEEWEMTIFYKPSATKAEVIKVFRRMLKAYMEENFSEFMQYVSEDFYGDLNALEDGLEKDFRFFDNIRINAHVRRVVKKGKEFELAFDFQRRMTSVKTGKILQDSSSSSMLFAQERDGVKLVEMSAPLIFGVSETGEVATSVYEDAVGDDVIMVDEEGNATTVEQEGTVEDTMEEMEGGGGFEYAEVTLAEEEGFDFSTETKHPAGDPSIDISYVAWPGILYWGSGPPHGIQRVPYTNLEDIKEAPESGYQPEVWPVSVGECFCVWTDDGKYVKFKILAVNDELTIEYYVSDTRQFAH